MTNKDEHEYLPLVKALAEGRTIEHQLCTGEWARHESPDFTLEAGRYRIVGEPAVPEQQRYYMPPDMLEALKAYILGASAEAMGAAFDYQKLWSDVLAANERKQP